MEANAPPPAAVAKLRTPFVEPLIPSTGDALAAHAFVPEAYSICPWETLDGQVAELQEGAEEAPDSSI